MKAVARASIVSRVLTAADGVASSMGLLRAMLVPVGALESADAFTKRSDVRGAGVIGVSAIRASLDADPGMEYG